MNIFFRYGDTKVVWETFMGGISTLRWLNNGLENSASNNYFSLFYFPQHF